MALPRKASHRIHLPPPGKRHHRKVVPFFGFRAHIGLQQKAQPYGNQHRCQGKAALPQGEPKEQRLTVGLDLVVDFYFQWFPPFGKRITPPGLEGVE